MDTNEREILDLANQVANYTDEYTPIKKFENRGKKQARTIENILIERASDYKKAGDEQKVEHMKEAAKRAYLQYDLNPNDEMYWEWDL